MAKYEVQIDVTMSGTIEIEASSEKEARIKAREIDFVAFDLRFFHWIGTEVIDWWEVE